ncbi:NUDIX domain-containing protein [Kocuria marina]|uniref:NUDIX domain-containing protein n=1 Tax=Kocuria marina TaxID=223184 RepID=UPI0022E22FCF|nr:NUDIX hydrolase [Kocuria marina]
MIDSITGWNFMPCSAKVVIIAKSSVLLGLNPRGEWELPGGWPDQDDETLEQTVIREVCEETGINLVDKLYLVGAELYSAQAGKKVAIITYTAFMETVPSLREIKTSKEHSSVSLHPLNDLPDNLPEFYVCLIDQAHDLLNGIGACASART